MKVGAKNALNFFETATNYFQFSFNLIGENNHVKKIIGKIQAIMCFQKIYLDRNPKFIYLSQDYDANLISLEE